MEHVARTPALKGPQHETELFDADIVWAEVATDSTSNTRSTAWIPPIFWMNNLDLSKKKK
jgi:hypothetical protein